MKTKQVVPLSTVVEAVQDSCRSDAEAIAALTAMLGCQRVVFRRDVRSLIQETHDITY